MKRNQTTIKKMSLQNTLHCIQTNKQINKQNKQHLKIVPIASYRWQMNTLRYEHTYIES